MGQQRRHHRRVVAVAREQDEDRDLRVPVAHLDGVDGELEVGRVAVHRGRDVDRLDGVQVEAPLDVPCVVVEAAEVSVGATPHEARVVGGEAVAEGLEEVTREVGRGAIPAYATLEVVVEVLVVDEDGGLPGALRALGYDFRHGSMAGNSRARRVARRRKLRRAGRRRPDSAPAWNPDGVCHRATERTGAAVACAPSAHLNVRCRVRAGGRARCPPTTGPPRCPTR